MKNEKVKTIEPKPEMKIFIELEAGEINRMIDLLNISVKSVGLGDEGVLNDCVYFKKKLLTAFEQIRKPIVK